MKLGIGLLTAALALYMGGVAWAYSFVPIPDSLFGILPSLLLIFWAGILYSEGYDILKGRRTDQ